MPNDPVYGEVEVLTPQEQQARGLLPPSPLTPSGPPVGEIRAAPTFLQKVGRHTKEELPGMAGMAASMLVPGSQAVRPIVGPALRVGAGMLGSGAAAAATGQKPGPAAGSFGITQAIVEAGFGATRLLANKALYSRYAQQKAGELVNLLKQKIPAWADLTGKASHVLHEMVYGTGRDALHEMYDQALKDAVKAGTGKIVTLPAEVAKELRIPSLTGETIGKATSAARGEVVSIPKEVLTGELVAVDAGETAKAMTGKWLKSPQAYRQAADALDAAGVGDPKIRAAYKWGTGFSEFADKTQMLQGGAYRPERATKGLEQLKNLKILERRDLTRELRGPLGSPVSTRQITPWEKFRVGAALGGIAGAATGQPLHGLGGFGAGGLLGEVLLPKELARHVPLGPLASQVGKFGPPLTGEAVRLGQRIRTTSTDDSE